LEDGIATDFAPNQRGGFGPHHYLERESKMKYSLMIASEKKSINPTYCGSTNEFYFANKWQGKGPYHYFLVGETSHNSAFIET